MKHGIIAAGLVLLAWASTQSAAASDAAHYPAKPIKLIVGYAPGGSTDILARLLARRLQEGLGQPVVVENRPGTSGIVGASVVAKSQPDGYTLMVGASGQIVFNAAVNHNLPYSPERDFVPVSSIATFPLIVSVKGNSKITSLQDLVKYTKDNPRETLNYGRHCTR